MKDNYCNINIGILGHVDCGKTTLCKSLTEVASTASLDNNTQSKERGITIDLGFSSFTIHNNQLLHNNDDDIITLPREFINNGYNKGIQCCLVDCPGHASLIKTIIGGAQIIDICFLVIDINKGIQAQTAECIVIANILSPQLMIILNKIDLIKDKNIRYNKIKIMEKKLRKTFENTRFTSSVPIIAISANNINETYDSVINMLINNIKLPKRLLLNTHYNNSNKLTNGGDHHHNNNDTNNNDQLFTFSFDHCFSIKGVGTISSGTVINGIINVGDKVIILDSSTGLNISNNSSTSTSSSNGGGEAGGVIKSIQIFKESVKLATCGDRCALCIPGINPNTLERGIIISNNNNNYYPVKSMLAVVDKIKYFKDDIKSKSKIHITCGHSTVMATVYFIKMNNNTITTTTTDNSKTAATGDNNNKLIISTLGGGVLLGNDQHIANNIINNNDSIIHTHDFTYRDKLLLPNDNDVDDDVVDDEVINYAIIELDKPILASPGSVFIASRLDKEYNNKCECRLAFYGIICKTYKYINDCRNDINIIKWKLKYGSIERLVVNNSNNSTSTYIIKNMFKKETDLKPFIGLKVKHNISGINGIIESSFGKSGKIKCTFNISKLPYIQFDNKGNIINTTSSTTTSVAAGNSDNNKNPAMVSLLFKKRVLNKDNNKSDIIQ